MVVMRNIRLPELDKNRNVDQQKALVFESKTCKYDVILGADFLTKTGIDVKYSTRTIEWFDNELPLCEDEAMKGNYKLYIYSYKKLKTSNLHITTD
jgi:hypothetical protein